MATVAIDSMTLLHPVHPGDPCRDPVKLTKGLFTFVAIDEAGKPRPMPAEGRPMGEET